MPQLNEPQSEFLRRYLGFRPTGKIAISPDENDRLAKLSPEELVQTDLTRCDSKELFSSDYMLALAKIEYKGEGNSDLKALMREVAKGLSGSRRAEVMDELSAIVGLPPTAEQLDADYGRFLIIKKQQDTNGKSKDEDMSDLDEEKHPEFMASRGQFMFGKVLGDAFGIHEVFASLLSPTGGLVGPGNWLIPGIVDACHLDPDNPVALHGCVHDAAGYLHTFHNEGPGYNYLDSDIEILGTGSPMSGQISGIAYWVSEVGDDYIERRVDEAVLKVEKELESARKSVSENIDKLLTRFKSTAKQAIDRVEDSALGVAEAIEGAARRVTETLVEKRKPTVVPVSNAADPQVGDKLKRMTNFLWS